MNLRSRKEKKRLIKPNGWYMLDITDPKRPAAMWRWYRTQRICEERIERYFGVNPLIYPVLGQFLIDHGMLLTICTNRKWGVVPHLYDYTEDETRRDRKLKRKELRKLQENKSSRR